MTDSGVIRVLCQTDQVFGINSYCIVCGEHAIVIDPILTPDLEQLTKGYTIDYAFLTHEHYDHIYSVNELRTMGVPILCGEKASHGLSNPQVNMSRYVEFLKQYIPFGTGEITSCDFSCQADQFLKDNERIEWQGHTLLIKEIPGHSVGSIAVLVDGMYLFSGDTIFKDYPTATRMPGGSTKAFKTITEPWLDSLPQDIIVYPGHTESFRLAERYKTVH